MTKTTKFTILLLIVIFSFTSCGTLEAIRKVNLSALTLGMSKDEVQKALKKTPDNVIATKRDPETNSVIQVVQYSQSNGQERVAVYWLYFENDKLTKWEEASKWRQPQI